MSFLIRFLTLFLFTAPLLAQYQKTEKFQFTGLGTREGLSQGRVTCILQDRSGFHWFGTADGLNRFDGYSFLVFRNNRNIKNSLTNNVIYDLTELPDGRIVVAHNQGIDIFDPVTQRFRHLALRDIKSRALHVKSVTQLVVPSNYSGFIYLGTHAGVLKLHMESSTTELVMPLSADPTENERSIRTMIEDSEGKLWIGTGGEGLYMLDVRTRQAKMVFMPKGNQLTVKNGTIPFLTTDSKGRIYASDLLGVHVFDKTGKVLRELKPPIKAVPIGIHSYENGTIIISFLKSGWFSYSFDEDKFTRITETEEAGQRNIPDILVFSKDRTGTYWGGTNGTGLVYFKPEGSLFKKVSHFGGHMKSVRSILELSDRSVMVSGYDGFARFDEGFSKLYPEKGNEPLKPGSYMVAFSMAEDIFEISKKVWMGTEGNGLYLYDVQNGKLERAGRVKGKSDFIRGDYVYSLHWGNDSLLWVATEFGLHSLNTRKGTVRYYPPLIAQDSLASFGIIFAIAEQGDKLFLCTERQGVMIFDRSTMSYKPFLSSETTPLAISSSDTRSIYIKDGYLFYIGTTSGLSVYDSGKKTVRDYSTHNGLPGDLIYGILEDRDGNIWVSTNVGIARFNPASGRFASFTLADGLQGYEFNSKAYHKLKDGSLVFGGTEGVNIIDPVKVNRTEILPPVLITGISLFSRKLPIGEFNGRVILDSAEHLKRSITLEHDENGISIEFSAFEPGTRYVYILEGLEAGYSIPSTDRRAIYSNLPPGKYTFRVYTLDREGNRAGNEASINITILPPFWQTWWFRTILAVVLAGILIGGYYMKVNAIRKRNVELESLVEQRTSQLEIKKKELEERNQELQEIDNSKNRFISTLAHDIRSPFSAILGYLQIVTEDYDELTDGEKRSYLNNVNSVSKSLYSTINNLLHWFRIEMGRVNFEPEELRLELLIRETTDVLSGNLSEKKIEVISEIEDGIMIFVDKIMLKTILQNLISNAIKFSHQDDVITISGDRKGDLYSISISDSGSGMTAEETDKLFKKETILVKEGTNKEKGTGLGLLICKEYVEINGGEIFVRSVPGEGTSFTFTVPLKKEDRQG